MTAISLHATSTSAWSRSTAKTKLGRALSRYSTVVPERTSSAGYTPGTDHARSSDDIDDHLLPEDAIMKRYTTSFELDRPENSYGVTDADASARLARYGPNALAPPKRRSWWLRYFDFLLSFFSILLITAGVLVYVLYAIDPSNDASNVYLGAILIGVAFINAFIEFYQVQKTASILNSFLSLIPATCMVIRESRMRQIPAAELVPGDVIFLRMGDKVPADAYLFSATEMRVDNSALTGESDPQMRSISNSFHRPLEATNLAFSGTLVTSGEGYGVVIRAGNHTMIGQIAGLAQSEAPNPSPLTVDVDKFVKIIAAIAITCAITFFVYGMLVYDANLIFNFTFAIAILVAWVPQGLPATMTVLLTIAANRMARRNVLVKNLQGVETLGAITMLATDKTGTLTRNQMTVAYIWTALQRHDVLSAPADAEKAVMVRSAPGVQDIVDMATLCSRVKFDRTDVPVLQRKLLGDATESGLMRFAATLNPGVDAMQEASPKVFEIPFNSETKWHMSIHEKPHANGPHTLYLKGAPERVLRICSAILTKDGPVPLTEDHHDQYLATYTFMAGQGHRVLAFAQYLLPESQYPAEYKFDLEQRNYPIRRLCFVGLVSLEDPPKHGVREAIGKCRLAGIKVMMITGDHPLTATAIARKVNIITSETLTQAAQRLGCIESEVLPDEFGAVVVHGESIDELTDNDWERILATDEVVFARTSPKHKLDIIKRAQAQGHIVGCSGDGVNDSPALKKADLGIAMNHSGSDVSKEAAAMILLDDNFASTVCGIEEGRLIFRNLKACIRYTLTNIMPEVMPTLLFVAVPLPLPLSTVLVLAIDLGFELFAAMSYAWENPESKGTTMCLPPRKPVTPASIARLQRIKARQLVASIDAETGDTIRPTRSAWFKHWWGNVCSSAYWRDVFNVEGEELIDGSLLSWSFLEIGMIESAACLTAYFVVLHQFGISPGDARSMQATAGSPYFKHSSPAYILSNGSSLIAARQVEALAQANSIYFLALCICQSFNLFACKARFRLPFGKFMVQNRKSFYGLTAGYAFAAGLVFIPALNVAFGTASNLNPINCLIPLAFGIAIIGYASLRILVNRTFWPVTFNSDISGLHMAPTVASLALENGSQQEMPIE